MATVVVVSSPAHATIADKRNDFNRDGISDVVAVNGYDMYFYAGDGNGGILPGVYKGTNWHPYSASLATPGDLNRDGIGDLVAIHEDNKCLYRWYGNGSGGFTGGTQLGCNWGPYEFVLAGAGDLNNDGNGDLLSVNSNNGCLYRWFGNGTGAFGSAAQLGCNAWSDYRASLTGVGDLNGDGNADVVSRNAVNECLYRWYGDGKGNLYGATQLGCNWGAYINFSGLGDLNGDGRGDLVAVNYHLDKLYRWLGNGTGSIGSAAVIGSSFNAAVYLPA
ncbi:FG-GAP repeat domain-containing protein [Micromonospora sp. NPDC049497]|uniref:FG-GAP repeat domain-containing protein n=1 Tax=Micromonospora sp. NPDC049497 TaxID=3364273 RepID=UPI0037BD8E50